MTFLFTQGHDCVSYLTNVKLVAIFMLMFVSMTLTLIQGHIESAKAKFSVELFRQVSKQHALNLLERRVGHATFILQTFIWLDQLVLL